MEEISEYLKKQIADFEKKADVSEVGIVTYVGDGVARIYGLDNCMASEMLELPNGVYGMALNLEEDNVGAILFGEDKLVKEGDIVKRTGRVMETPVGEELIGRVVNAVGLPIDGKGPINAKASRKVDVIAPGIIKRQPVKEPLQTGIKVRKGVYFGLQGPTFETAAEYRMIRILGADAVGMSTVPEVITAKWMNTKVLGLSIITDICLPDAMEPVSHEIVLNAANSAAPKLSRLIVEVVKKI
mgnify:CR=1 FL=1